MSYQIFYKKTFLFLVGILSALSGLAQLDNSAFYRYQEVDSSKYHQLYLSVSTLGFLKDNEYFNNIADGYTLFGNQLAPSLVYYPLKNVRIEAGVFLHKDFGNNKYSEISPLMSITVLKNDMSLIFGSLQGSLNHGLIEPMYDFEKIMNDRNENGLQILLNKKRVDLDAWVDWEYMLYKGDSAQEEISGGLNTLITVFEKSDFTLKFPFQFTAMHYGGQIDASPFPLKTVLNAATGIKLSQKLKGSFLNSIGFEPYFVYYDDFSFEKTDAYDSGKALYLNMILKTTITNLIVSYWQGNQYISTHGGLLYNSRSTTFKQPDYTEPKRGLIMFRFLTDYVLSDNFIITTRLEPLYDFNLQKLEFAVGFYINYKDRFLLKNIKK